MIDPKISKRLKRILDAASKLNASWVESIRFYYNGYVRDDDPKSGVIAAADWNDITRWNPETRNFDTLDNTPSRVAELLEHIDVAIEWNDTTDSCAECDKVFETQPDHYGWEPAFAEMDDERICQDCLDPIEWLESIENTIRCNQVGTIDPTDHGYLLVLEDLERGFHSGQDADPRLIADALRKRNITRFLFHIDSSGQFDVRFSLYIHLDGLKKSESLKKLYKEDFKAAQPWGARWVTRPKEMQEIALNLLREHLKGKTDGPSVSGAMERGLREASAQMGKLEGEGIKYARITEEGVQVRLVSPEEFVKGIK